ncbi:MAG: hypothetical protein JNL01_03425 [Bdellovibrionales bacterium]|nr:hypothetical protein [Bdellovibrionales bacterium]
MTLRLLHVGIAMGLSMGFSVPEAKAAQVSELGIGFSRTAPMGMQYVGFRGGWSFFTEALVNGTSFLGPAYKLHFAAQFQTYPIANQTGVSYNLASVVAGLHIQTPTGKRGTMTAVSPFFSLLGGAAFDWLSLSATNTAANLVVSAGGALQAIPGIEFPLTNSMGLAASFPIQGFFMAKPLYVWNGLLHLRISL